MDLIAKTIHFLVVNIEIDKTQNGVFNIILNAITAGEIGKNNN